MGGGLSHETNVVWGIDRRQAWWYTRAHVPIYVKGGHQVLMIKLRPPKTFTKGGANWQIPSQNMLRRK
nr:MAG TPA: hypothetical protein [Caudoviricetes sp.]